jgi:hypothetical protein
MKFRVTANIWTLWLLFFAGSFAVLEGIAIAHGELTLSRYMVLANDAWPLVSALVGGLFFALLTHWFWPWAPLRNTADEPHVPMAKRTRRRRQVRRVR